MPVNSLGHVQQIQIYHCKDTACVHEHPGKKGATLALQPITDAAPSEVQSKMMIMGHQIPSCHVPVIRSFFIL
jgi:hypothetical protein